MSGSARVLLADDDVRLTRSLQRRLEAEGFSVAVCEDGVEALQRAIEWSPHVAVLDHFMPGLSGRELCQRMRELGVGVPVILLTSAAAVVDRVAGLEAGADDYLCKPFEMDELVARVRAQLRRAGPLRMSTSAARALIEGLQDRDPGRRTAAAEAIRAAGGGLQFQMLGDFGIYWHGVEASGALWNRRQPRVMLKLLLLQCGRKVPFELLIEQIWPACDLEAGRKVLHVTARRLRRGLEVFGQDRLETTEGAYRLTLASDDALDLREFDALQAEIERELSQPTGPTRLAARLQRLGELFRGDLLEEEPYADWAVGPRARCRAGFSDLLGRGARRLRTGGDLPTACALWTRLWRLEPADEERTAELVECLMEQNDRAAAAEVASRTAAILRDELGIQAGPRLAALLRSLDP